MAYSHNIYAAFKRLTNKPLDPSGIFESLEALKKYVESEITTAYIGQYLVVVGETNDAGIYFIYAAGKYKKVLDEEKINELIDGKLDLVKEDVKKNTEKIEELGNNIVEINNEISEVKTDIAEKYNEISERISDEVETILGGKNLDESLDTIKELAERIKYIEDNEDSETLNSIRELKEWILEHGEETTGALEVIKENQEKIAALEKQLGNLDNSLAERVDELEKTLKESVETELVEIKNNIETIKNDYAKKSEVSDYLVGVEKRLSKDFVLNGNIIEPVLDIPTNSNINLIRLNIKEISESNDITNLSIYGIDNADTKDVFAMINSENDNIDNIIPEIGITDYNVNYKVVNDGFRLVIQIAQTGIISGNVEISYIIEKT